MACVLARERADEVSLSFLPWGLAKEIATPHHVPFLSFAKLFSIAAVVLVPCNWNESVAHSKEFKFVDVYPIEYVPVSDGNSQNSSLINNADGRNLWYRKGMERSDGFVFASGENSTSVEHLLPKLLLSPILIVASIHLTIAGVLP
jgi:hypothetical protein